MTFKYFGCLDLEPLCSICTVLSVMKPLIILPKWKGVPIFYILIINPLCFKMSKASTMSRQLQPSDQPFTFGQTLVGCRRSVPVLLFDVESELFFTDNLVFHVVVVDFRNVELRQFAEYCKSKLIVQHLFGNLGLAPVSDTSMKSAFSSVCSNTVVRECC